MDAEQPGYKLLLIEDAGITGSYTCYSSLIFHTLIVCCMPHVDLVWSLEKLVRKPGSVIVVHRWQSKHREAEWITTESTDRIRPSGLLVHVTIIFPYYVKFSLGNIVI